MMVCPSCGRTVTDPSMGFCPACGYSFAQQPSQPYQSYAPYQYGPQPYARPDYPRKSMVIAFLLSFLVPGVGQLYVGKVLRGIVYILTLIALAAASFVLTMNVDVNDVASINRAATDPLFILVTLASLGVWAFSLYDTYRLVNKYNEASMRNDLPRFLKDF
jgi:TM2 domain-containing membrane protein YozV